MVVVVVVAVAVVVVVVVDDGVWRRVPAGYCGFGVQDIEEDDVAARSFWAGHHNSGVAASRPALLLPCIPPSGFLRHVHMLSISCFQPCACCEYLLPCPSLLASRSRHPTQVSATVKRHQSGMSRNVSVQES